MVGDDGVARCWWGAGDPLYRRYHDTEWGRPVAEDRRLFEKLSLEGFQAGLSWLTILRKREHFREVFSGFDPTAVARFGVQQVERLLADPGIVRNRAKIEATINNARRYAELATEFGGLAAYVWRYEPDPQARPLEQQREAGGARDRRQPPAAERAPARLRFDGSPAIRTVQPARIGHRR